MQRWYPLAGLIVVALFGVPAHATEALRPALRGLSQKVAAVLKEQRKDTVAVGAFTGPAKYQASAGPGIQKLLIEELQQCGIRVDRQADLEAKGEYRPLQKPQRPLELQLTIAIVDSQTGAKVAELGGSVPDPSVLPAVLSVTCVDPQVELVRQGKAAKKPVEVIREERDRLARGDEQLQSLVVATALGLQKSDTPWPGPSVEGGIVRAGATRPYGVEILVKGPSGYASRPASLSEGLPFVALEKSEVFAVRLVNDADHDVAVELTLDGLNLFAFSDEKGARFVVVPPKQATTVVGWHRDRKTAEAFVITDYGKSAAAEKLIASDQVGTITAAFHAAWEKGQPPPADEYGRGAIGRGEQLAVESRGVQREVGRRRDVVSVRYNK